MRKTYHMAMIEDKRFGLGTLLKVGAVCAAGFVAYTQLVKKDEAAPETGSPTSAAASKFSVDKAARDASEFAAKVLKAAKKVPDALKQ
ncbi:MAG: hypothetical protein LBC58_04065 [Clostridiales Family XIII bacterium]|jgi:hypothetical protein|nr:hypothetical protein [Clostridiales Family XIII bacterium]